MPKTLKVGFDLDGVLLYNPVRIVRPLIALLKKKKICIDREELEFYVPKNRKEEIIWEIFHLSSLFVAPGYKRIAKLKQQNKIEPYLITARFAHLNNDFERWKRRMKADEVFLGSYLNIKDEQPHKFKERMLKKLDLDVFIEDNWDIVHYLDQHFDQKQILWVSNLIDKSRDYQYKYLNLDSALDQLEQLIDS